MKHRCVVRGPLYSVFFFFNDTATTEIYTLSLHDALPILSAQGGEPRNFRCHARACCGSLLRRPHRAQPARSEEHTSELQSRLHLVCRLLLEKKKRVGIAFEVGAGHSSVTRASYCVLFPMH